MRGREGGTKEGKEREERLTETHTVYLHGCDEAGGDGARLHTHTHTHAAFTARFLPPSAKTISWRACDCRRRQPCFLA